MFPISEADSVMTSAGNPLLNDQWEESNPWINVSDATFIRLFEAHALIVFPPPAVLSF